MRRLALAAAVLATTGVGVSAQQLELPALPVDTFTLSNGLRIVVSEEHSAPVAAVSLWFHAGRAADPTAGGLAHVLEHLLSEETARLGVGRARRLVAEAGGVSRATTDLDRTSFLEVVPSDQIRLALWVQADRLRPPPLSAEVWEGEIRAIRQEMGRILTQPYADAQTTADTIATASAAYRSALDWQSRGDPADLDPANVREFHRRWFVPSNASLVVVGDVDTDSVREWVEEYFGSLAGGERLPASWLAPDSARSGRVVSREGDATAPLLWVAYGVPGADHRDRHALAVLSALLSGGQSSRLHQRLVEEQRLAASVFSVLNLRRGPGTLLFAVALEPDVDPDLAESLVLSILEEVAAEGVAADEIEKAVRQRVAGVVRRRLTVAERAEDLQRELLFSGSPFGANEEIAGLQAVGELDLVRVSALFLHPSNRAVVRVEPVTGGAR